MKPVDFKKLSEKIMFSGITGKYIADYGLQYRKTGGFESYDAINQRRF